QSEVLDNETLLLEYSLGEERSFLWAVTTTSVASYELANRAEIEATTQHLYQLITARGERKKFETRAKQQKRIAQADKEFPRVAMKLSKMLLGPVAGQLHEKRLLIVADGALLYLPFGLLPNIAQQPAVEIGKNRARKILPFPLI